MTVGGLAPTMLRGQYSGVNDMNNPRPGRFARRGIVTGGVGAIVAAGFAPTAEAADSIPLSDKGAAGGVATLDQSKHLPYQQLPGPYFYAEEYGVVVNDPSVDNSDMVQQAIDDAALSSGTVILPLGTIHIRKTIWLPMNRINLIGGGYLTVIAANPAFSATDKYVFAVKNPASVPPWVTSRPDAPIVQRSVLSNLGIYGPTGTNSTLDGILWDRPADAPQTGSVGGWHLERVAFRGFRYQETFASGAFLVTHRNCSYSDPLKAANYYKGGGNMGEAIQFEECVFQGGLNYSARSAIYAPTAVNGTGIDAYYKFCSFDYINRFGVIATGTWNFFGCHFETNSAKPGFVVASPAEKVRPTRLVFVGGQIIPHDGTETLNERATDWSTFLRIDDIDPFTDTAMTSTYLVFATFTGVDLMNGMSNVPARIVDDTKTDPATGVRSKNDKLVTTFAGCFNGTGRGSSTLSVGGDSAVVLLNADFRKPVAVSTASAPSQADLNKGWQIAKSAAATKPPAAPTALSVAIVDEGTSPFSSSALRFNAGAVNSLLMWQVIERPARATVVQSNLVAFNNGSFVGNLAVRLTQLDGAFATISGSVASVYMSGENTQSKKVDGGGVWKLDPLTRFVIVQFEATGVAVGAGIATVQCLELTAIA